MKNKYWLLTIALLLNGCALHTEQPEETAEPTPTIEVSTGDYQDYASLWANQATYDSYTIAVRSSYTFTYSDDSTEVYQMDGVLAVDDSGDTPRATLSEYINGNGIAVNMDGIYVDGRIYNTYYGVQYYEDMTFAQLKQTMLVPVDLVQIDDTAIDQMNVTEEAGNMTYVMTLGEEAGTRLFTSRYDFNELSTYDIAYESGVIAQIFDSLGNIMGQQTTFNLSLTVGSDTVHVLYESEVTYLNVNTTVVDLAFDESSYVAYADIDTEAISDADITDDSAEATVTETLRKRIVGRLGYEQQSDGTYKTTFNDSESYTIDFENRQFVYTNHTSVYVYNWRGDTGGFGTSCNYNYSTETGSSDCQESVLETLQDIKLYFELELYYCGISLADLVSEG